MATKSALRNLKVVDGETRATTPKGLKAAVNEQSFHVQSTGETVAKDHFIERNGMKYAGTHLLVELWGAKNLGDLALTEAALREGATTAGATILHCHLHHFGPNAGLSGVLVLAESHISIHTWPEREYAAIDIFMCGVCDPYQAIPAIKRAFGPASVQIVESRRGVMA